MNDALLVSGLLGMAIALLFIRLSSLERRLNRLSRLDAKMDALLKHTGIDFDEYQGVRGRRAGSSRTRRDDPGPQTRPAGDRRRAERTQGVRRRSPPPTRDGTLVHHQL